MKIIDAVFATSEKIARAQMAIDPQTGLISDFGDLGVPQAQVEFFSDDCLAFMPVKMFQGSISIKKIF
jgi:hypothetical protein